VQPLSNPKVIASPVNLANRECPHYLADLFKSFKPISRHGLIWPIAVRISANLLKFIYCLHVKINELDLLKEAGGHNKSKAK